MNNRFFIQFIYAITFAFVCPVSAKDIPLSGEQDGTFEKGDYVVTKTVTVAKGKTIRFAAGSVVRFRPYTGLIVDGSIICDGSPSAPVVLTSDENRLPSPGKNASPAPFDWNGIEVGESADSCVCSFVQISYSTFGILVKSPRTTVTLDNVTFQKNGRGDVNVAGADQSAQDNVPFSYKSTAEKMPPSVSLTKEEKPSSSPTKPFPWKLTARIGSGTVLVAGAVIGIYGFVDAQNNYSAYHSARDTSTANNDWKKVKTSVTVRNIGYVLAAIGAAGLAITFFF